VSAAEGADTLAVTAVAEPDSRLIVVYHCVCNVVSVAKNIKSQQQRRQTKQSNTKDARESLLCIEKANRYCLLLIMTILGHDDTELVSNFPEFETITCDNCSDRSDKDRYVPDFMAGLHNHLCHADAGTKAMSKKQKTECG
jgi:hypothetical protein